MSIRRPTRAQVLRFFVNVLVIFPAAFILRSRGWEAWLGFLVWASVFHLVVFELAASEKA